MIFFEDNNVKVGELTLPGIFKSLEIDADALIEEQEIEGNGKKPKQATGWGDAVIKIELIVSDTEDGQTADDKIKAINNIFKPSGQSVPTVQNIVNSHTAARGINKVLFKKLTTKETNNDDNISVTLEFVEYYPVTVTVKKTSSASKTNTSTSATVSKTTEATINNNNKVNKDTIMLPQLPWEKPKTSLSILDTLGVDK